MNSESAVEHGPALPLLHVDRGLAWREIALVVYEGLEMPTTTKSLLMTVAAVVLLGCDGDNRPPSDKGHSVLDAGDADGAAAGTGGSGLTGGTGGDGTADDAGGADVDAAAGPGTDAAVGDAGPVLPDAGGLDAFDGMCASSRWSTVSDACWGCWCTQCAASLNAATRRSMEIFECMFEKELLVNNAFELACEVRAGQQECVGTSTDDWNKLVTFDQCLMTLPPLFTFRHCETECGVTYPGDVCTRYP